jgi:hypothetical protein
MGAARPRVAGIELSGRLRVRRGGVDGGEMGFYDTSRETGRLRRSGGVRGGGSQFM